MRSLAKKLFGAMTTEGRPQAFYWQYGWADGGFLIKNNIALVKTAGGSPTRRLTTNGGKENIANKGGTNVVSRTASD